MLRHVVMISLLDDAPEGARDELVDALRSLPPLIDDIASYEVGADLGLRDDSADVVVVADFADEAAWRRYLDHPEHVRVVTDVLPRVSTGRRSVQYEAPDGG